MSGGTEAFPDLGKHCQEESCKQLDFLPFRCDGCQKVFCSEHRSYKSHDCPEHNSRVVVVCETCAVSIEKKAGEDDEMILERHKNSGHCDPTKKHKPRCPVRRCKEVLTFSNKSTCKICNQKVCLKHRFPADHACKRALDNNSKHPVVSLQTRNGNGTQCREINKQRVPSPPSINAY